VLKSFQPLLRTDS